MTVSLPMYDLPCCAEATRIWRQALADRLGTELADSADPHSLWAAPDLVLSQTCGWPLLTSESERLRPVATLVHGAKGCGREADCARYCSYLVVRDGGPVTRVEDAVGGVAAVNGWDSWSGRVILAHAFRNAVPLGEPVFQNVFISGAHAKSLMAVRAGRADIAAIDNVTFSLLQRHQPAMIEGLIVLAETDWAPALPYVIRKEAAEEQVWRARAAIADALADPELADVRAALLIEDWVATDLAAYDRSKILASQARSVWLSENEPALPDV